MSNDKVLVLGSKGMLGQELFCIYDADSRYDAVGWDVEEIDITNFLKLGKKLDEYSPALILNAVAYNAVDQCETDGTEFDRAMLLNARVPEFLANYAAQKNSIVVHYSTDYVFDGRIESGYTEDAEPNPLSRYGMSKWEGEKRVSLEGKRYYIIRLSKLFGQPAASATGKKSFFETMLRIAAEKPAVTVVDDERSCFTYAPDLAQATKLLTEDAAPFGIYHLANTAPATWYEATRELFRITGLNTKIIPVRPEAFPRPARRPRFSELLNTKRPSLRPYTDALREFWNVNKLGW